MQAKFLTTVNVRSNPSTSSEIVAKYEKGETVNYDQTLKNEGRLWISYIANSGNRRYCCARDTSGEIYIDNVISNNSNNNNNPNVNNNSNNKKKNNSSYPFLQTQSKYEAVRKEGCLFCAICFLGGLNNIDEVDECFVWAVSKGKVRENDSYVNTNRIDLAKEIAKKYGRKYRNYHIYKGNNHFYIVDSNGNEIYNSSGPGWGH